MCPVFRCFYPEIELLAASKIGVFITRHLCQYNKTESSVMITKSLVSIALSETVAPVSMKLLQKI